MVTGSAQAAGIVITKADYSPKKQILTINAVHKRLSGNLLILHGSGGVLAEQDVAGRADSYKIPLSSLGQVPCSVEARLAGQRAMHKVRGAPASCNKRMPVCKILAPRNGDKLTMGDPVTFKGKALPKRKKDGPLTYRWDFGGGVFDNSHPTDLEDQVKFVRDNSLYRVRFIATDRNQNQCEASVEVLVGNLPDTGLAKVPEQNHPLRGSGLNPDNAFVVLPFQDLTMQETNDTKTTPTMWLPSNHVRANLQAHLIKKGSVGVDKPQILFDQDRFQLQYSAASNPLDPVGAESINSTSQNWPLNADPQSPAPFATATLQKTDMWELPTRPAADLRAPDYEIGRTNWVDRWVEKKFFFSSAINPIAPVDEGLFPRLDPTPMTRDDFVALSSERWKSWFPDRTDAQVTTQLGNQYNNFLGELKTNIRSFGSKPGTSPPGAR